MSHIINTLEEKMDIKLPPLKSLHTQIEIQINPLFMSSGKTLASKSIIYTHKSLHSVYIMHWTLKTHEQNIISPNHLFTNLKFAFQKYNEHSTNSLN